MPTKIWSQIYLPLCIKGFKQTESTFFDFPRNIHKQFLQISKISIELCYKTVSDKIDTTACQTIKIRIQNGFGLLLKNDWIDGPDLIVGSTVAMSTTSTKSSLKRFAEY